ncbi:hypothetical protein [Alkalihalophilus marmarensis]|uniref:Uncharacterized protein n=1 Tax=Alkalihalophilus marmarensis DSM 21297 TaxID=1188261 RepID=U6SQE4_9BACI|nr:hypothetical protein [Alkalihalophilus marmarensis]ERN53929.1 hypothetical protein A33I_09380 [Alkalihalophilus marmarensis DSM 21297]
MSHFKSTIRTLILAFILLTIFMLAFNITVPLADDFLDMMISALVIYLIYGILPLGYLGCLIGEAFFQLSKKYLYSSKVLGSVLYSLIGLVYAIGFYYVAFSNSADEMWILFAFVIVFVFCSVFYYLQRVKD